jgi:tetratricopeptide (TPR) repeat protein
MAESPVSRFTYRAFISYSHRDKAWADWLHKALETYSVPSRLVGTTTAHGIIPRRLNPVFRDREELASATDLGRKVNEALAQSESQIVICSPAAATSRWVNEEVLAYKRMGRAGRIFCLIVDGEPDATDLPGRASEECFCPALRFVTDADGRPTTERTEPIAADARPGKDGKSNAKLKLIAGMLDVGFDALKQREQHRRMRRMATITTTALVVMAVTIVLAIAALVARHDAVIARQAAERRQKQAEGLVDFMLGDLSDKLTQVQRLDIMQAVDDKAMAYFRSLPIADATPTALSQRAAALTEIGYVRQNQGNLDGALDAFGAAAQLAGSLAQATPSDNQVQLQHARILAFIGQARWQQGDLDAAQRNFEAARGVLTRAAAHGADSLELTFKLEMLDNNLGHVHEARGELALAAAAYHRALESSEKLVAARPDNADWQEELGGAHNNLGKLALLNGNLATAIAEYADDEKIESALSARDPRNNNQSDATLTVRAILGRTLAMAGDDQAGLRYLGHAVQMAEKLVKIDPANSGFQDDLALYSTQLARLQRLNGDLAAAEKLTARSTGILAALVGKDPTNSYFQSDLIAARLERAAESLAAGNVDAAHAGAQAALQSLDPLLAKQPDDRGLLLARLESQLLLARTGHSPEEALTLRAAIIQAAQNQRSGRDDPRLLALQVEALLDSNRTADAQALIQQLWKSGYRDAALLATLRRRDIPYPVNASFLARLPTEEIASDGPHGMTK